MLDRLTSRHRRVITRAVHEEIARGVGKYPELQEVLDTDWLEIVHVDGLDELVAVAEYMRRLGSGEHDMGEATVLAWAEVHGAIAVVDERVGTRHGRERAVEVHGTLWLIAIGVRQGLLTDEQASEVVQKLSDADATFPCDGQTFIAWARANGLLE